MRKRIHRLTFAVPVLLVLVLSMGRPGRAESVQTTEYQVKAAFLFNFVKFTDGERFGPAADQGQSKSDPNEPIVVGILGRVPSKEGFEGLAGKRVKDRPVAVRHFKSLEELKDAEGRIPERHPSLEDIRKCHVLFICPSEKAYWQKVLPDLRNDGILIVGDVPGFLQAGGTINFVIEEKKVRFEINLAATARAKLQIRSSLLRLAIRVVEHDSLERPDHEEK